MRTGLFGYPDGPGPWAMTGALNVIASSASSGPLTLRALCPIDLMISIPPWRTTRGLTLLC